MSDLSGNAIPGSIETIRCGLSSPFSTFRRELTDVTQERDRLRSELVEARAREAELKDRLQEYHDNAHYDDEDKLYIGCCITESQYQDTANLLAASDPSLARVRAGELKSLLDEMHQDLRPWIATASEDYQNGLNFALAHIEDRITRLNDQAARLRAGKEERPNETC